MTKTNSVVKRIIAIVLSAMFALTSFTITGFVPTMDAYAAGVNDYTFRTLESNAYFSVSGSAATLPTKNVSRSTDPEWYTVDGISGAKFNTTRSLTYRCADSTLKNAGVASTFQSSSNAGDTIAFMAYTQASPDGNPMFVIHNNNYNATSYKTIFSMAANGTLDYTNNSGTSSDFNGTYSELKTSQGWHTYVIKFGESYSGSNKTISFYIDGVLKKQIKSEFADDHTIDIPDSITIGCNVGMTARTTSVIRDFRFYNTKSIDVAAIDTDLRESAIANKITVAPVAYGLVSPGDASGRISNGLYNVVNDQQTSNTDAVILRYDLSEIRNKLGEDYEIDTATFTGKVESYDTETSFDGLKYFYTTSSTPSQYVTTTGGYYSNKGGFTCGSGSSAPNSFVASMGGSTSDYIHTGTNDYTVAKGSKAFTNIDFKLALNRLLEGSAQYVYVIIMQNKAGQSAGTGGWTDTKIYPQAQTLTYTFTQKAPPEPFDPSEALAIINEYIPKVESLFANMTAETNVKRQFPAMYKAYVNCQEALDEYTYNNTAETAEDIKLHLSDTARAIKKAYDEGYTTNWQTPYGGEKGYYNGTDASGYYSNLLYSSTSLQSGVQSPNFNGAWDAWSRFDTNKVHVLLYDGNTQPSFPIQMFGKNAATKTWQSATKTYIWTMYPVSSSGSETANSSFELTQKWKGNWDTTPNNNTWIAPSGNEYINYTSDTSSSISLSVERYLYFSNVLKYKGTGNTSNYYETFNGSDFTFRTCAWTANDGTQTKNSVYTTFNTGVRIYVINYKNLRQNLRNTTHIGYFKNLTNYKQGELGTLAEAYEQGMRVDPNSKFLAKTGSDDNVAEWVSSVANEIKYATQNFNGIGTPQTDAQSPYPALREQLDRAKLVVESPLFTKEGVITNESKLALNSAYKNARELMAYNTLTCGSTSVTDDYPTKNVAPYTAQLKNAIDGLIYVFNFSFVDSTVTPSVQVDKSYTVVGSATINKADITDVPALQKIYININDEKHNKNEWNISESYSISTSGDNSFTVEVSKTEENCSFGTETVIDATCMREGSKTKTCTLCNHDVITIIEIDPDAHSYGEWFRLDDAQHIRYCENENAEGTQTCNASQTENHSYIKEQDPSDPLKAHFTCTCGDEYVGYEGAYGYWNVDEYVQLGTFQIRGKNYSSVAELIEDNFDEFTNKNIDTGINGRHIYVSGDLFDQDGDKLIFYPINCSGDSGWKSSHKDETCLEDGYDKVHCDICGNDVTTVIPAKGHTEVIDPAVTATCTQPGFTEGSHCSVCGTVIVAQERIEPLGHSWDDGVETKAPTCVSTGIMTFTCQRAGCGQQKTETIPVDPEAHNYIATLVVNPTCTTDGYTEYTCKYCSNVQVGDIIGKLGHNYQSKLTTINDVYTWNSQCSRCQDIEQQLKLLDLSAYVSAVTLANESIANEDAFTEASRGELSAIVESNKIPYNQFTDEVPSYTQAGVDLGTGNINTANKTTSEGGVLVPNPLTVTFNYVKDNGEVEQQFSQAKDYLDEVEFNVDSIADAENYAVVKWLREVGGEESPIQSYNRKINYIASKNAVYTVFLSSVNKPTPADSVNAKMYDRLNRIREVQTVKAGEYTAKYDTENDEFTLKNKSASETYHFDLPNYSFYVIDGFKVNGVDVGFGQSADVTVSSDFSIVPKYRANVEMNIYAKQGQFTVKGSGISKSSTTQSFDVYTGAKWDSLVTFTADSVKDWYVCTDLNKALDDESNFVLAHRGTTFDYRISNSMTVVMTKDVVQDTAVSFTSYLTSCEYRDNTITSVSRYYLPENVEFVEAGVIYKTGSTGASQLEAITDEQILSGQTIKGLFKASVFVEDTNQYTINYHSTAVNPSLKVAAKSYLIYNDNGNVKVQFSDIVTYNY